METKRCTKCGEVKELEEFNRNAMGRLGRTAKCKSCRRSEAADYRTRNSVRIKSDNKVYKARRRLEVPEKIRVANREYMARDRAADPEKYRARNRGHYRKNPDAYKAAVARRRATQTAATVEQFKPVEIWLDWEEADLWDCFYCGCALTSENLEVEHFYPLVPDDEDAPPGPHALFNLVPSCRDCNRGTGGKHSREPWAFLREALIARGVDLDRCLQLFDVDEPHDAQP